MNAEARPSVMLGLSSASKVVVFALPFVFSLGFICLRRFSRSDYYRLVREDGPVELAQACLFFGAFLVALMISRRLFQDRMMVVGLAFVGLAGGLLFVAGEEISWGQRIFGIETPPSLAAANMQGEITVHNLKALGGIVHKAFIAIGIFAVGGKILCYLLAPRVLGSPWNLIFVDGFVVPFFVPFLGIYVVYEFLNQWIEPWYGFPLVLWQDLETAEFFLASGFFVFVLTKCFQLRGNCL